MTPSEPLTVLVTGSTGFLGRVLVPYLAADPALTVLAGTRMAGGSVPPGSTQRVHGDLAEAPDLDAALSGVDVIVHCAGRAHVTKETAADPLPLFLKANTEATLHLARSASRAGVKRFIFISSIGVNGSTGTGTAFRAEDVPAPTADYAISKFEAEKGLMALASETGLEAVIIRPPLIIGPDPVGNLATLSKLIGTGLPLPFGSVRGNKRSLVSATTVSHLIKHCLEHPAALGQVFLVADNPPMSTRDILERLGDETNQKVRLLPFPPRLLGAMLRAIGRGKMAEQLLGDLEVDVAHTETTLGWSPR